MLDFLVQSEGGGMKASRDTGSTRRQEGRFPDVSLLRLDDLDLAYGSQRLTDELGPTAFDIWITLAPPGEAIVPGRPEQGRRLLLVHRGEIEIEWDDLSVLRLRPGDLAWLHPPTPRALRNTGSGDAAFVSFVGKRGSDAGA
jgi:quercetin dioxygenase-like cupin family protein